MNEKFLYYLWKNKLIQGAIALTNGNPVSIIDPGIHNMESGPDFFNARIKIEDTVWAGNIEIHVRSSDWKLHSHHINKSYDNVILHVVFEDDEPIFYQNDEPVPTLVLRDYFDITILERYERLAMGRGFIPCSGTVAKCDDFVLMSWLENIAAERLMKRQEEIESVLEQTKNDWNQAYYIRLCRNFGFKINEEPFEFLGRILSLSVLLKHADNKVHIEAMIFGAAGLLEHDFHDEYPKLLQREFSFFQKKFNLKPIESHLWKFMRTHPRNFPAIRLAQFSEIVFNGGVQFSNILEANNVWDLKKMFQVSPSPYWKTHYRFDKPSPNREKPLGEDAVNLLLINTLLPFIFAYGRLRGDLSYCEKAIDFFQQLPPEDNHIIRSWKEAGIKAGNAMDSQALLHLKQFYCSTKRCLQCRIGDYLLRSIN